MKYLKSDPNPLAGGEKIRTKKKETRPKIKNYKGNTYSLMGGDRF